MNYIGPDGERCMPAPSRSLKELFLAALEVAPEDRAGWLERECAADAGLCGHLRLMLAAHDAPQSLLDRPAGYPAASLPCEGVCPTVDQPMVVGPGTIIGPYKLLEPIGEGGMGTVWMAQQTEPVRRLVAVKLIKAGMDSKQVSARFEAERQALALMDHANIARVLDAGTSSAGRPYFVMDLVKGVPITKYCDEHRLTPRQRLELFVPVCQAVQHAHQKGIIHRDLKPSNVLVAPYDGKPVPKVIDFGVAKAAGQTLTDKTLVTGFGALVGTLEYMSPEQAEVNQLDIDTRSDIYSLGVLLYELLTGSPPFTRKESEQGGMLEMLRVIREQEPTKPSAKLSTAEGLPTLAANRGTEPARLARLVRGELDWIAMKALEKDRNRRYETANSLALDVQRYLADEPVLACPPSAGYRFRKFARRHRSGMAVVGLLLFFLLVLGSGAGWAWRDRAARAAEQANHLERAIERAESLQREGRHGEALAALERARLLSRETKPASPLAGRIDALQQRLDAEGRDETFVAQFEAIRRDVQTEIDVRKNQFTVGKGYPWLREALEQYGLAPRVTPPPAAVAALQKRPAAIQTVVVAALDECLRFARKEDPDTRQWLVDVLRQADSDPWRNKVRQARGPATLEALVTNVDVRQQPPSFLLLVVRALPDGSPRRLPLARRVQFAYPGDFWANMELGWDLDRTGNHAEAIRYFTAALSLRPDNPVVLLQRSYALRGVRELEAARADVERAVALAPQYAAAHDGLGDVLRDQKKPDEAIACYTKALELDPKFEAAHYSLAEAYAALGRWDQVAAAYERILEFAPENHESWRLAAYAHLGAGDAVGYRRICRETVERFGLTEDPVIAQRAAMTCSLAPDAVADFGPVERLTRRAVTGTEKHVYYRYFVLAKGLTEERAGRHAEAITWLERFAPTAGGGHWDATTFAALAMAQHRLGRTDDAKASLARAKAIVAQRMPDPSRGRPFGPNWLDVLHAQILSGEAEELLAKKSSAAK
jgi:serine/threonine protein kinase/Flp pilus assembly protein TadD